MDKDTDLFPAEVKYNELHASEMAVLKEECARLRHLHKIAFSHWMSCLNTITELRAELRLQPFRHGDTK